MIVRYTALKHFIQRFALRRAVVFFIPLIGLIACKDDRLLGLEVQPEDSLSPVNAIDSFTIHTSTIEGTAQRSSQYRMFVGALNNDIFGRSEAILYLNFQLESENITLDNDPSDYVIDSVVLSIFPREVYGNGNVPLTLDVYPLDEPLILDSIYASNSSFRLDDSPIGSTSISIASNDDILNLIADSAYNGVQWRIDKEIGSFLLNGLGSEYTDSPQLKNYFNGVGIKVRSSSVVDGGAIYDFAIASGESGITIHYHLQSDPRVKEELQLEIASNTSRVNQFLHDPSNSLVSTYLNNPNADEDLMFVQGMAGVKARIDIPYLDEFGATTDVAINLATISVEAAPEQPDYLEVAPRLYLLDFEVDSETGEVIETLNLDYIFSSNRHGGTYDESSATYTFDVTRQVQKTIENAQNGKNVNLGWTLNSQVPVLNDNRVYQNVLKGSDNIVFKIYYTDISK